MALVTASPASSNAQPNPQDRTQNETKPDLSRSLSGLANGEARASPDLQRALDLVDLHYSVKEKYVNGAGVEGLQEARRNVERALSSMK